MKIPTVGTAVGAVAVAGGAAAIALTTGAAGANAALPAKVNLASASSPVAAAPAAAADQAAISYVDRNFTGTATAAVLKTEADTDHGVPVYDVRVQAPNGTTYSLSIRTSNDSVMSAHPAENQAVPTSPRANQVPANGSSNTQAPVTTGSKDVPELPQTPEPKSNSQTNQNDSQASKDHQQSNQQAKVDN